ncbi:MAG TPA: ATP-binding protein, partial [Actinoallomurus sp.]|nr:ATP-binding protein [Actinoallomurus sp.]
MTAFTFAPATKEAAKARIALAGPSGSGKTYTALVTARALAAGGKVAVIDTERESASLYADEFTFDTLNMHAYDPRDLVKALGAAGAAGYAVVIVDSLSHFWMGSGGMLEQVDHAAKRSYGGNSFGGWKEARPMERQMIDALLGYPGHVIVTMRTKTEWVVQENERGRKEPKKIGTKPEQRDGIEYEFT